MSHSATVTRVLCCCCGSFVHLQYLPEVHHLALYLEPLVLMQYYTCAKMTAHANENGGLDCCQGQWTDGEERIEGNDGRIDRQEQRWTVIV